MPRPKTPDDLDVSAKLKSDPVGLDQMIVNAIQKCDGDLQTDLYGSVVLAGGTSTMSGIFLFFAPLISSHNYEKI